MGKAKKILLKLTGEIITQSPAGLNADAVRSIAQQILQLSPAYQFSIVIGGGNFFRGTKAGPEIKLTPQVAHSVGMIATMMNGLIIQDIFEQQGIKTAMLNALNCPEVGEPISYQNIRVYQENQRCLIFTGGTGNPFFTTDTTAVLRALQIDADELWKATKVDGVYDKDPRTHADAKQYHQLSYQEAIDQKLAIMDLNAFVLAEQHNVPIRIFNLFTPESLLKTAHEKNFGTIIR